MWARTLAFVLLLVGAVIGLVICLIPARCLPAGLVPFSEVSGRLNGQPVEVAPPPLARRSFPASVELNLDQGHCEVIRRDAEGKGYRLVRTGKGSVRLTLSAGERLLIDPGPNTGSYHVFIGLPCSVIHEAGHLVFGVALGGTADQVVWTVFSGDEPHVSFSHLPETAAPWMSAGGNLLPTLVGLVLLGIWLPLSRRTPWWLQVGITVACYGIVARRMKHLWASGSPQS